MVKVLLFNYNKKIPNNYIDEYYIIVSVESIGCLRHGQTESGLPMRGL